jgi:hypothetical protein
VYIRHWRIVHALAASDDRRDAGIFGTSQGVADGSGAKGAHRFFSGQSDSGRSDAGTGGARKLRWAAKGRGKSGGARAITFYGGPEMPVFLLTVFAKGDRANLSKAERNELRAVLMDLLAEYRKGTR